MRSTLRDMCVGLVLIYSPLVVSASIEGGRVTDVGPEAGVVFTNASQAFLIRGRDEAVATSGRAVKSPLPRPARRAR